MPASRPAGDPAASDRPEGAHPEAAGTAAAHHPAAAFVHDSAVVDAGATLEPGVKVWHFAHVSDGARLGEGTMLGQGVYVGPNVSVGARCRIQNHVSLFEGVVLADEVFIGPSATFTNVLHPRAHLNQRHEFKNTVVGRRVTVGANATILCGTTLGESCFVGAGAVVTHDVAPRVLVVGCPARPVGNVCDCGQRLPADGLTCPRCALAFQRTPDGGLRPAGEPAA